MNSTGNIRSFGDIFTVAKVVNTFKSFRKRVGAAMKGNEFQGGNPLNSEYDRQNAAWALKASKDPFRSSFPQLEEYKEMKNKMSQFQPARFTGKLRFRKTKSAENLDALNKQVEIEDDSITVKKQFKLYCQATSMHGFQYITENKRWIIERIFWICWCLFGMVSAAYMMSSIWTKWERNPVITSVSSTNFPVANIIFPAVTICTVNKAVTEKMIIQGCRFNYTLSQMKTIIAILVDPDSRNNDHTNAEKVQIKPEDALYFLRLVAPKCSDYLLRCSWNSQRVHCKSLFRLVLTDSGYCCTFNAVESKRQRRTAKHDEEVQMQEAEYDFLQKAVWDYTDNFRISNSNPSETEEMNTTSSIDSFSCVREFDDDLFPGICKFIQKCRDDPKTCKMGKPAVATEAPTNVFAELFPLKVAGAGRSRGLTLMLDTLRCDTVPTDSFKGLRVFVHNGDDFPAVAERGYIVGPGQETQIGVTATDTFSREVLRGFSAFTRGCFFPNEFPLKFYKEYSRSACVVECETEFVNQECDCVTYFAPGNYSVCGLQKYLQCVKPALDAIQKKTLPTAMMDRDKNNPFKFKTKKDMAQDKSCAQFCLPACNETFYNIFVTAADFPNQPEPNQTKMLREAIQDGHVNLNNINYVSGSISVLRIFFRESSILQYKRDELFTWEDFVSNLGGVMGLCMGFSLLSLVEVIYFFTIRLFIDKKNLKKAHAASEVVITGHGVKY